MLVLTTAASMSMTRASAASVYNDSPAVLVTRMRACRLD